MATMMCRAHGPVEGETCSITGCFEPLQPYAPTVASPVGTCPAAGCGMPLPCPLHPAGSADAGHREVAAHFARTTPPEPALHSDHTGAARGLRFPWGTVQVPESGVTVGRDFTDDCGEPIAQYDNVSRAHARVYIDGDRLAIVDLDSTNGTTANDVRLRPAEPALVDTGDVLGFGNRLRCTVVPGADAL